MRRDQVTLEPVVNLVKPPGVTNPAPRSYFLTSHPMDSIEATSLERTLRERCHHVSGVFPCQETPDRQPANFYVSWGLDSEAPSTLSHIGSHFGELKRAIGDWLVT